MSQKEASVAQQVASGSNGYSLVARALKAAGIKHMFGVIGIPVTELASAAQVCTGDLSTGCAGDLLAAWIPSSAMTTEVFARRYSPRHVMLGFVPCLAPHYVGCRRPVHCHHPGFYGCWRLPPYWWI